MAASRLGWGVAAAALLPIGGAVAARYIGYAVGPELGTLLLVLNLVALGGVLLLAGKALTGLASGFLLNGLNRYSLSRAQVALWTVVVFAALLTTAEWNLCLAPGTDMTGGATGPLDIGVPTALLTALGISLFSGAAAPAIVTMRGDATLPASEAQLAAAADRTRTLTGREPDLQAKGQVVSNRDISTASWQELLTGDEVALTGKVDLSKVQQAMLTVIVAGIYLAAFVEGLRGGQWLPALPPLGADAVRLLAISHAGYLAFKAIPKPDAAAADGAAAGDAAPALAMVRGAAE